MKYLCAIFVVLFIHIIDKQACGIRDQKFVGNDSVKISSTDLSQAYNDHDYAPVWVFYTIPTARLHFSIRQVGFYGTLCTFELGDGPVTQSSTMIASFVSYGVASEVRSVHNSAWLSVRFDQYTTIKEIPNVEIKVDSESDSVTSPSSTHGIESQDPGTTKSRGVSHVTIRPSSAHSAAGKAGSKHHGPPGTTTEEEEKAAIPIDMILIIIFFSTTFVLLVMSLHWLHHKFRRPHVSLLHQRTSAWNLLRSTPVKVPLTGTKSAYPGMEQKNGAYPTTSDNIYVIDGRA